MEIYKVNLLKFLITYKKIQIKKKIGLYLWANMNLRQTF